MLGKVLKYEMKSGVRQLLPFFGLAIASAGVLRLILLLGGFFSEFVSNILLNFTTGLGTLLIIAVLLIAIALMVMRFYRSMSASEAYLTFTLPVKPTTHLLGRLLSGSLFVLLGFVTAFICGAVFYPGFLQSVGAATTTINVNGEQIAASSAIPLTFSTKAAIIGTVVGFLIVLAPILLMHLYTAVAIGTQFGKSRLIGSVVGYFIINTAQSVLSVPVMLIAVLGLLGTGIDQLEARIAAYFNPALALTDPNAFTMRVLSFVWAIFGIVFVYQLILTTIEFFVTKHIFTKRLNLE